jgi:hypothetical protein
MINEQIEAVIGETLLVYQAIEHLMKKIASAAEISVPVAGVKKAIKKRMRSIAKSTMGNVVDEYLKIFEPYAFDERSDSEAWIQIKLDIGKWREDHAGWEKEIEELIGDRNWLVHQSLTGLRSSDSEVKNRTEEKIRQCNMKAKTALTALQFDNKIVELGISTLPELVAFTVQQHCQIVDPKSECDLQAPVLAK